MLGCSKKGVTMIGSPCGRDDAAGQPLATPPLDAGEIVEARPGFDEYRADAVALHQLLRLGQALQALGAGDRRRDRDRRQFARPPGASTRSSGKRHRCGQRAARST